MKTVVSLEQLKFWAFHGVYEQERQEGNEFLCDVQVELKSFDSLDDNIHDTVNYEDIYKIVESEMTQQKRLLETVCLLIINRIKELDNVVAATVRIKKSNPPLGGDVKRAVVEMQF